GRVGNAGIFGSHAFSCPRTSAHTAALQTKKPNLTTRLLRQEQFKRSSRDTWIHGMIVVLAGTCCLSSVQIAGQAPCHCFFDGQSQVFPWAEYCAGVSQGIRAKATLSQVRQVKGVMGF